MKVDLRSDTVTRPSAAMREAMAAAPVGDDAYGEDPTVNELQRRVAELLGKESALYVPSGTMANQIAIRCQTHHGDEIVMERTCHPFNFESGAVAALSGVMVNLVDGDRGRFCVEDIEQLIRPPDHHFAQTALLSLENTTNRGGGAIFDVKEIARIREFAVEHKLRMHLDGARLLNACVETGVAPREYAQHFDTVSICLSKGLGAPVGSVLSGPAETIDKAHKFRKMFGGGMRQAGIIAAAGIYALDNNVDRLREDHRRARRLAEAVSSVASLKIKWPVDTNFVMIDVSGTGLSVAEVVERLGAEGVRILGAFETLRAVTHLDVDDDGIEYAAEAFRRLLG